MSGNFKKEDLRIKKTYKALMSAMVTLLEQRNFNQITVNDLCCEALISRATFYIHFNDKYDLLKYWLSDINGHILKDVYNYEQLEISVNQFIQKNKKIIANILIDANNETLDLVNKFVEIIIDSVIDKYGYSKNKNSTILSNFCTGGIVNLVLLQVKRRFPKDENIMTLFLFDMIKNIMEWVQEKQNN